MQIFLCFAFQACIDASCFFYNLALSSSKGRSLLHRHLLQIFVKLKSLFFVSDSPDNITELDNYASPTFRIHCSANLYYGDRYQFSAYVFRIDDGVLKSSTVTVSEPFTAIYGLALPK